MKRLTFLCVGLYVAYISAQHSVSPVTFFLSHCSLCLPLLAGNSIQRIKTDSSLNEPQPPPYQDEDSACLSSHSRSERGVKRRSPPHACDSPRCSSEASEDQNTECYPNKGCEEDIPSDSTAVLGPEVRSELHYVLSSVSVIST